MKLARLGPIEEPVFAVGRAMADRWGEALGAPVEHVPLPVIGRSEPRAGRVIALVGGAERGPDLRWFAFRIGVLNVAGMKTIGIGPTGAPGRERSLRFARLQRGNLRLELHDGCLDDALRAADIAVAAPGSGPLVYERAARLGVPIVGVGTRSIDEAVHPDPEVLLARRPDSPRMVWVLARILEGDPPSGQLNGVAAAPGDAFGDALVELWSRSVGASA